MTLAQKLKQKSDRNSSLLYNVMPLVVSAIDM